MPWRDLTLQKTFDVIHVPGRVGHKEIQIGPQERVLSGDLRSYLGRGTVIDDTQTAGKVYIWGKGAWKEPGPDGQRWVIHEQKDSA